MRVPNAPAPTPDHVAARRDAANTSQRAKDRARHRRARTPRERLGDSCEEPTSTQASHWPLYKRHPRKMWDLVNRVELAKLFRRDLKTLANADVLVELSRRYGDEVMAVPGVPLAECREQLERDRRSLNLTVAGLAARYGTTTDRIRAIMSPRPSRVEDGDRKRRRRRRTDEA